MSDRPSDLEFKLQHLVIAVKDLITEWYDLGLQLGLPDSTLRPIGSNPDIEGRLRMMLSKWLDYDTEASWEKLADALTTMGKNVVAANIRSKFVLRAATALEADDDMTGQEINRNILQKIKCQFASVQLKIRSAMEARQVKVSDVHQFLVASFQGDSDIPEASDLTKLFNVITVAKLWRYDHYVPLQELAEQFLPDDEQVKKHIADYRNRLAGFCTTTKIVNFINLSELEESEDDPQQPFTPEKYKKYYRKLKIKLKLDKKITELTLSYVNTLWESLAEEFDLPSLTAVIDKIIDGSLVIAWLILPHIADKIQASISKALRFYQQHSIVEIHIDDKLLYDQEWIVHSTLLYQASFMGNTNEVKELLEGGANVNEPNDNKYGETALFGACQQGQAETARVLVDHGANVDYKNKDGDTGLMLASERGSTNTVRVLLEAKADPNITDEDGETALHLASKNDHVEVVKMLVHYRAAVDIGNMHGYTGLMVASGGGCTETVRVLLEAKADPNITSEDGWDTLYWAAINDHPEVIKLLLNYGAAIDIRTKDGWTGLMRASMKGYTETVRVLLEAKADPNITVEDGWGTLHWAAVNDRPEVIKLLLNYGAAIDIRTKKGVTGLMLASDEGYTETVRVLLEAKANPNVTDEDGWAALHWATFTDRVEVVKMLVNHGTAVDIRNKEGLTALDIARGLGHQAVCEVLEQYTKQETRTELTEEQRESIYQRLLKMVERTFLKEQVKKREEQQKEHHHQREERVRGEREKISLWNRLRGRQNRPEQIIGTAPAPEK